MANIKHLLDKIRTAIYGKEVRGSLADGLQAVNNESEDAKEISVNVEQRQDAVEEQFDDVLKELSDDREVDNAETIAARTNRVTGENHKTLGNRLDDENKQVTKQLAQTEKEIFKGSLINRKSNRKMVVWQDDDGRAGIYTKLAPILRDYGIVMSASVYTNGGHGFPISGLPSHSSRYISYEQMKELHDEGIVEFVSHTHGHTYLDGATDEQIHYELKTSRDILKQLGFNYKDFVYPGGRNDANIRFITSQYYESATIVGGYPGDDAIDQYAIPRIGTPNTGWDLEERKGFVDDMLDKQGFAVLLTHVDLDEGLDIPKFKQLIEYILSTGAEFVTMRELIEEHGNVLQAGDNIITSKGEVRGSELGVYRRDDSKQDNPPISAFPKGTVTRTNVLQQNADNFHIPKFGNEPVYGFIETHRALTTDTFSAQYFYDIRNGRILNRRWSNPVGDWLDWTPNSGSYNDVGGMSPNSEVNEFPKGRITKMRVTQDDAVNYNVPALGDNPTYGFIEVHRDVEQDVFSTQIFYDVRNKRMTMRRWNGSIDNWNDWEPVGGYYHILTNLPSKNAPITAFEKGIVTKFNVLQDDAADYNIPSGTNPSFGYIETHRDSSTDTFSSQIFYDIRNKRTLMRRWTQGAWDDWE